SGINQVCTCLVPSSLEHRGDICLSEQGTEKEHREGNLHPLKSTMLPYLLWSTHTHSCTHTRTHIRTHTHTHTHTHTPTPTPTHTHTHTHTLSSSPILPLSCRHLSVCGDCH